MKRCENCSYAAKHTKEAVWCRRYPPTITKVEGDTITSFFPIVNVLAVCGEWKRKTVIRRILDMVL